MTRQSKLLDKILRGTSDTNIAFTDLCQLLSRLGFDERIRGSHHIFTKEGVEEMMKMIRYEVIIYWSDEDEAFLAEVPELPGCMADGVTYQEALANVEGVIQEWIDTARELGRPIPEPKGRLIFA
jgi:predicted RNase H-like HicB family nuclease